MMKNWTLDLIVGLALVVALVSTVLLVSPARGYTEFVAAEPVLVTGQAACHTLNAAIAVIEAGEDKVKVFEEQGCVIARGYGVHVTVSAIVGTVVWAGDGLDDLMYIVEVVDGRGMTFYGWLIVTEWPSLPVRLRGDAI